MNPNTADRIVGIICVLILLGIAIITVCQWFFDIEGLL